jgi:hypothetical protein
LGNSHPSLAVENRVLQDRYLDTRPRIVRMLVNIGRHSHAFSLAERHTDFKTLVELCQDPLIGSSAKTAHFIEKYKETFAFALFDWLVEKGASLAPLCYVLTMRKANSKHYWLRMTPTLLCCKPTLLRPTMRESPGCTTLRYTS